MQISLNWLNDYVDIKDLPAATVAQAFTDVGLEIEGMTQQAAFSSDVVVGKILTAEKHPNADALRCCTVDVGAKSPEGPLAIVCGAPNARPGIFVAVAMVGAVLPGDFKIKKSKIRGENSNGMLCSGKELGLTEDSDGIIELTAAEGETLGLPVGKVLGTEDTVLTVNVTPNRGDCLGYLGLARDLAAKLKRPLKDFQASGSGKATLKPKADVTTKGHVRVEIEDDLLCPRFVALYLKNVTVVPAPSWMQKRLEASGIRPINLVVDATNYAMLEYGQPVHAYDERDVGGNVLVVRAAKAGETLVTLDGQKRVLVPSDLVIADEGGVIGLAGLMGGQNSEIKADTTAVIIEVATFSPERIRKTARRLALHTDASHRFERGVDWEALPEVARRVAALIQVGAAGAVDAAGDVVDTQLEPVSRRVVAIRLSQTQALLGLPKLTKEEAASLLTALKFELMDSNADRMVFRVPSWRWDIEREVDLIEEIARLGGFEKIPYQLPVMNIRPNAEDPYIEFQDNARVVLAAYGLREAITFPFVATADIEAFQFGEGHPLKPCLALANPLNADTPYLRTSLTVNLLAALRNNRRQGDFGAKLFEVGRGFFDAKVDGGPYPTWARVGRPSRHHAARARQDAGRPIERTFLAVALDQPFRGQSWSGAEERAEFFHGKAVVEATLKAFGVSHVRYERPTAADLPFLHPGRSAALAVGEGPGTKYLGFVGELHPKTAQALSLDGAEAPVIVEIDLEELFGLIGKGLKLDTETRRFPPVTRDLALLVDREVTHEKMLGAFKQFKRRKFLTTSALFDVFDQAGKVPNGKKSLAYAMKFQSAEKTLTDAEVEGELEALVAWLKESTGAERR